MGIFSRAFEERATVTTGGRLDVLDDFWYGLIGGDTKAGIRVNEKTAHKYLTFLSCISLISRDIANLPKHLYQKNKDGSRGRVTGHFLSDKFIINPNPNTSAFNLFELGQMQLLTWGNTMARPKRAPLSGDIISLTQIPEIETMQVKSEKGQIVYMWRDAEGNKHRELRKNIFHVPGFGYNGIVGAPPLSFARETIGLGLALEEFGERYFGQGTHPAGVLELDTFLKDQEQAFIDSVKKQATGLGKSHKFMVLEGGAKYKPITVPLEDAQFLGTRDHQKVEICGWLSVPPHKIALHGQNSNYNNLEQENGSYVNSCLVHWAKRWEQNIMLQLLTESERIQGLYVEFLFDALLRGDSQARGEFYTKLWQIGAMTSNEIRAKENMNPLEGGDTPYIPLNFIPANMAEDYALPPSPPMEAKSYRKKSTIKLRDRIKKRYYPLFKDAAQKIVNREGLAVKKEINRQRKQRAQGNMAQWLNDFYRKMPEYIRQELGPVIRSYMEAIHDAAALEIGMEPGLTSKLERLVDDYIEGYSGRHIRSSLGQLTALLEEEISELEKRVDEWEEKRPDKIATNETVRASEAMVAATFFAGGFGLVWNIRGVSTCPYCESLQGKRVSDGEAFVEAGTEMDGGEKGPMIIRGLTQHPPLHGGCDCYLTPG